VGEQVGHVISVFVLSGAIFGLAYLFVKARPPLWSSTLIQIGLFWLALCLLFEFGFFHYAMHEPWEKLWANYHIFQGRLLILVWLITLFSPLVCGTLFEVYPIVKTKKSANEERLLDVRTERHGRWWPILKRRRLPLLMLGP
jgi:hypothetical protein